MYHQWYSNLWSWDACMYCVYMPCVCVDVSLGRYICIHIIWLCVCMWAHVNAYILVTVSRHLCLSVCVRVYVCLCVCVSVCSFVHACIRGCLSLIYFADLQFMYQILLLEVKVLLLVGLFSTLITDGIISIPYSGFLSRGINNRVR